MIANSAKANQHAEIVSTLNALNYVFYKRIGEC